MEAKYEEITLGEPVCIKLRNIYHDGVPWVDCHSEVSAKFTQLKSIVNKFYVDKTHIEALKELIKYTDQDIIEAFEQG